MLTDLLFRVACHGGGDEPLNVHLKRITDSAYTRTTLSGVAIEGELVAPVIAESHDEECRRDIMRHMRECLSESSGKRWQRIYGGLALTENLMQHGSPELLKEVAQGLHFDLVQKVSILEKFDAAARGCSDRRAQNAVRTKAKDVHAMLVVLLEKARAEDLQISSVDCKDTMSICSSGVSTATPTSSAASSTESSPSATAGTPDSWHFGNVHIDDAFADLRDWMDSGELSPPLSPASGPADSEISIDELNDLDWEPLEYSAPSISTAAVTQVNTYNGNEDAFFTPMPSHAFALQTHGPSAALSP